MMRIECFVLGMVSTNCYIAYDEAAKQAIVIDPADDPTRLVRFMEEKGLSLQAVLLTHGHFDHIMGVKELQNRFLVPVYAGKKEEELLSNPEWNYSSGLSGGISLSVDKLVGDGEELTFGPLTCRVIETPGHTRGSVCYYFEAEKALFSGDTLFQETVGRCDLPTGNLHVLLESIQSKLMVLPDEVEVYPGHGDKTSIGYERRNNCYLNGNGWE